MCRHANEPLAPAQYHFLYDGLHQKEHRRRRKYPDDWEAGPGQLGRQRPFRKILMPMMMMAVLTNLCWHSKMPSRCWENVISGIE